MQKDSTLSALEIGMMLQLANDLVAEYGALIEMNEKINAKTLKLIKLQDSFKDEDSIDEWINKNNKSINGLRNQAQSLDKLKKHLEKTISKHIDENIDNNEDNMKYKAFLYDWKI